MLFILLTPKLFLYGSRLSISTTLTCVYLRYTIHIIFTHSTYLTCYYIYVIKQSAIILENNSLTYFRPMNIINYIITY